MARFFVVMCCISLDLVLFVVVGYVGVAEFIVSVLIRISVCLELCFMLEV